MRRRVLIVHKPQKRILKIVIHLNGHLKLLVAQLLPNLYDLLVARQSLEGILKVHVMRLRVLHSQHVRGVLQQLHHRALLHLLADILALGVGLIAVLRGVYTSLGGLSPTNALSLALGLQLNAGFALVRLDLFLSDGPEIALTVEYACGIQRSVESFEAIAFVFSAVGFAEVIEVLSDFALDFIATERTTFLAYG